jgi:hypothetical protein
MSRSHHSGAKLGLLWRWSTRAPIQTVTRCVSSSYFEVPKRGTQLWIDEWISKQRICPFAKNSHNEIVVCPPMLTNDSMFEFMVNEVRDFDKSKSPPGKHSCRLLVFPNQAVLFDIMSPLVALDLERKCEGLLGIAGLNYEPRDDRMTIQATVFSSPESLTASRASTKKSAQLAPWNTIQLVKFAQLKKARGLKAEDRSRDIVLRNYKFDSELAATYPDEGILEYFRSFRERGKKKVIQVFQQPSEKDTERLEQEGYTIEIISSEDQPDDKSSKINGIHCPRVKKPNAPRKKYKKKR